MGDRIDHSLDSRPIDRSTVKADNARNPAHALDDTHVAQLPHHIGKVGLHHSIMKGDGHRVSRTRTGYRTRNLTSTEELLVERKLVHRVRPRSRCHTHFMKLSHEFIARTRAGVGIHESDI